MGTDCTEEITNANLPSADPILDIYWNWDKNINRGPQSTSLYFEVINQANKLLNKTYFILLPWSIKLEIFQKSLKFCARMWQCRERSPSSHISPHRDKGTSPSTAHDPYPLDFTTAPQDSGTPCQRSQSGFLGPCGLFAWNGVYC